MIDVKNLGKVYYDGVDEEYWAIKNVSFQAKPGEILGLLGPNGAGKTTLLRILSTMLEPSEGNATVCGIDVQLEPEKVRNKIGFVSANTAVYDRMTAWEFVEFYGSLYLNDSTLLKSRMNRLFDEFQISQYKDQFCAKMSTGMKQKVSLVRALVHDPPVLIFDEATLGLDIVAGRSVLKVVKQLRDTGKCILFSSHIMREVERLCDRVAILHKGCIEIEGTQEELIRRYGKDDLEEFFFEIITGPEKNGNDPTLQEVAS